MPDYRRAHVPGASFFFTVVVHRRRQLVADAVAVQLLGSVFHRCFLRWPLTVNAIVLLPDHLHTIWSLAPNDAAYSKRWGWLKKNFTQEWSSTRMTLAGAVPASVLDVILDGNGEGALTRGAI